jgi:hypothetical protein
MFTIKFADYHSRDLPFRFDQENMLFFRARTVWELRECAAVGLWTVIWVCSHESYRPRAQYNDALFKTIGRAFIACDGFLFSL